MRRKPGAGLAVVVALAVIAVTLLATPPASAGPTPRPAPSAAVVETTTSLARSVARHVRIDADHIAVYWRGHPEAEVTVAFSRDGVRFGRAVDVGRDEVGEQRGDGRTYSAVLSTRDASFVRLTSNRSLQRATLVAIRDRVSGVLRRLKPLTTTPAPAYAPQPAIISRAGWGADESLRFRANGTEKWRPTFHPVQKLMVHHTAGTNGDRNPGATIRAIYHYHAVTQGWGDIGYNFLVDEAGRIYKGRHSHSGGSAADTTTGEDSNGNSVTGAHARDYNAGSVGVALLGNYTNTNATPAARNAVADLLAWKADKHGVDPRESSRYTNPTSGAQRVFPNLAGHRDVGATACPGGSFYATLPQLRDEVAARRRR